MNASRKLSRPLRASTIPWGFFILFLIVLPVVPAGAEDIQIETSRTEDAEAGSTFWIRRAFVVDPSTDLAEPLVPVLSDLRIEKGLIAHIEPTQPDAALGPGDIDAGGRFLVPGFIDTHAHVALGPVRMDMGDEGPRLSIERDPEVERRSLLALLAHGITTVRDPGGNLEVLSGLRRELETGERIGPRLRFAGEVIDRSTFEGLTSAVLGPEAVRAEVRRQAKGGADWIKLYTGLDESELQAGVEEAHAHGLKAVAHLQRVSWTDAAGMGLDALVHGVPGSEKLLPSERRDAYLPDLAGTRFLYSWFEHADFESEEIRTMLGALKKAGTTLDLTLVAFDAMVRGNEPWRTRDLPELELAAPGLVENWRTFFTFNIGWVPDDFRRAKQVWPRALEFARLLADAGVHLTIGTDANNPWTVPGPSFHRELELLAEAGFSPRELLRMATTHGAESLGLSATVGALRPGFVADLVLLGRNPLDDVSAARDIVWVMREGRIHEPEALLGELRNPS